MVGNYNKFNLYCNIGKKTMKNKKYIFILCILSIFSVSCVSTIETAKNDSLSILKEDEGFILLRIINPNVGKTIDKFYYSDGEPVKNQYFLQLNSDLQIKKAPGSFSFFTVANTEAPEQFVVLKAKKGSYGIIKIGNNSEYINPYVFKVEAGVVNYVGDIKLDIVTGRFLIWHKVKDYYDFSVADNFDEILSLKESSNYLSKYSSFKFINQSKKIEIRHPINCHVIRDK
jgi:hypothetical protein